MTQLIPASVRRFATAHTVTPSWAATYVGLVVAAAVLQRLPLPAVDPDPMVGHRPLETLGTVLGLVLSAAICHLLPDRCSQLRASASRSMVGWDAGLVGSALALALVAGAVVGVVAPESGASVSGAALCYALIVGVHAAVATWTGSGSIGLAVAAVGVVAASRSEIVPWDWNVLFNPTLAGPAIVVASGCWLLALVGAVRVGAGLRLRTTSSAS